MILSKLFLVSVTKKLDQLSRILYFLGLAIGITTVSFIIHQNSREYQKYLIKNQQVSTLVQNCINNSELNC